MGGRHIVKTENGSYDLTSYATNPRHEILLEQVLTGVKRRGWEEYLRAARLTREIPITDEMVIGAAESYGVSPELMVAIMQVDSGLGTIGKGARTHNPGNVGNTDDGSTRDWGTWEEGVKAVARNLSKRRVVYGEKYHGI